MERDYKSNALAERSSREKTNKMGTGLTGFYAAMLVASVTAVPISYGADGHLHIFEASNVNNVLDAIFYTSETGIHIRGDTTSLTITAMSNNKVLLAGNKPHSSSKLTSVMGSSFLQYESVSEGGERRKVEVIVPESLVDQTKEAIESRKEERIVSRLNGIDETETLTARERAFERLFSRPELTLLENASYALGRAGILGHENQGALNFYGFAIAILRQQHGGSGERGSGDSSEVPNENNASRFKRLFGWRWCSNVGHYCRRCPIGSSCLGRCGPGCWWCWWFVCRSCCYHQGCYDHDICCGRYGYFSSECLVPIGFSCGGYPC